MLFFFKNKIIAGFKYNISNKSELREKATEIYNTTRDHISDTPDNSFGVELPSEEIYTWRTIFQISQRVGYKISEIEEMRLSWIEGLQSIIQTTSFPSEEENRDYLENFIEKNHKKLPESVNKILQLFIDTIDDSVTSTYHKILNAFSTININEIIIFISENTPPDNSIEPQEIWYLDMWLRLYLWIEDHTQYGLVLPWINEKGNIN